AVQREAQEAAPLKPGKLGDEFSYIELTPEHRELFLIASDPSPANRDNREKALAELRKEVNLFLNLTLDFLPSKDPLVAAFTSGCIREFNPSLLEKVVYNVPNEYVTEADEFYASLFYSLAWVPSVKIQQYLCSAIEGLSDRALSKGLYAIARLGGVNSKEWKDITKYLKHENDYIRKNAYLAFIPLDKKDMKMLKKALAKERYFIRDAICLKLVGEGIETDWPARNIYEKIINAVFNAGPLPEHVLERYYYEMKRVYSSKYFKKN
ncbi:hypothetical protein ACFL6D_02950, partial [Spirochaetota bacterium]